ncbi:glucosylceramidase-like protein, partial [Leptotrombidium deliense]
DPPKLQKGFITIVETTKQGKRFSTSTVAFQNKSNFDKHGLERYVDITINREKEYQTIIGFGGAFTDAATINIKSLPEHLSQRLVKDYFAEDGLEYNIGRIPIGGSDFSTRMYTYDDISNGTDFELKHFKLAEEDIKFKIPIIKSAISVAAGKISLFGSAWGPPAWMKTNNGTKGVGKLKGSVDGPYYKTWASYAVK